MQQRFQALDIFRGMTIAAMILVNTPGSWAYVYPPLLHADWHSCTPTDLVFPFFLYIVGAAIFFAFKKYNYSISPKAAIKIIKRTLVIFFIGLALNAFPFIGRDYEKLRIMGVLQRIALAYGIGAFSILLIKRKSWLWMFSIVILLLYWLILYTFSTDPYSLESNFARSIDLKILGEQHMWKGKGIPFDPEGLLSTLPAVISVVIGYLTIPLFVQKQMQWLKTSALALGLIGIALIWHQWFPINKSMWTSSYVLLSSGLAIGVLLILKLIETQFKQTAQIFGIFIHFGSNPLFIFVLSIVWVKTLFRITLTSQSGETMNAYKYIYQEIMTPIFGVMNGSLAFALAHIILFWGIAYILYKNKIYIKV